MTDALTLVWALAAGVMLGAFFFGGLWWTIRKVSECRRPALLFMGSYLLRTGVALVGLYLVLAGDHWARLLACLLGFVMARLILTKLARPPVVPCARPTNEAGHAS